MERKRMTILRGVTPRELLIQTVLLLVLLALLFPAVLRGHTLLPGGLLHDVPPWKAHRPAEYEPPPNEVAIEVFILFNMYYAVTKQALDEGEWPFWNPLEFGGMPLLANYQSAVFYPLRLLHAVFSIPIATTIFIMLRLWLCGMTAYLCARYFRLGAAAARFASVGWMLSGYNVIWAYWADPDVAAWLPVMLIAAEMLVEGRFLRGFCAMALSGTLMLLAGHPESAFTMSLGIGAYFVLRLVFDRKRGGALAAKLAVAASAWGLVLLVTSVQTVPFIEYLSNSYTFLHRPADEAAMHFMPASSFVAFWVPRFFGANADGNFWLDGVQNANFVGMVFMGVTVWLCLPLVIVRTARGRGEVFRLVALAVPALLFLLLAFDVPLFRPVTRLPLLAATWGCWYMGFPMFALVLLGAFGLERWASCSRRPASLGRIVPVVLLAGVPIGLLYFIHHGVLDLQGTGGYVRTQVLVAAGTVIVAVVCLIAYCRHSNRALLANALVLVLAAELLFASRGLYGHARKEEVLFDTPLTDYLQELEPPARVNITSARIHTGLLQAYGIEQMYGYDGILPERMYTFLGGMSGEPWEKMEPLCATRYYLHDPEAEPTFAVDDSERFKLLTTLDGVEVYENLKAQPRAFLVGALEAEPDGDALFERMRSPDYEPLDVALTLLHESPRTQVRPDSPSRNAGDAEVITRTTTRVVIDVNARQDAVLVLADAYYPGWEVTVDGVAEKGFSVYYAFRGVVVSRGEHTVEWRYRPSSFTPDLASSVGAQVVSVLWLGLPLVVSLIARKRVRQRRSSDEQLK